MSEHFEEKSFAFRAIFWRSFFSFSFENLQQKIKFVIKELNKLILFFPLFVIYVQRNYVISDFVSIKLMHNKLV